MTFLDVHGTFCLTVYGQAARVVQRLFFFDLFKGSDFKQLWKEGIPVQYTPEDLYDQVMPIIQGIGFSLVDCTYGVVKGTHHIGIVLFSPDGVGTDGCAKVYQTLLPRFEVMLDTRDIHLEVGSPGLDRKIRHPREYGIFTGKKVRVYISGQDWVSGIIEKVNEEELILQVNDQKQTIKLSSIGKAQLEFTWEVK